jgi:hypothetical protein
VPLTDVGASYPGTFAPVEEQPRLLVVHSVRSSSEISEGNENADFGEAAGNAARTHPRGK